MVRYVGIDLHKRLLVVCILDEQGQVVERLKIEEVSHASLDRLGREHLRPEDRVAVEVTTNTWPVERLLRPFVGQVVVSNPLVTKAIAQAKVKTDKVDAFVLAQLLRLDYLPTVWVPDEELCRLRELTARRARLGQDRTKLINRIRSCLAMRLLDCPHELTVPKGREWLRSVELDAEGRFLVDADLRLLDAVQSEIAALDQWLAQRLYQDERVKLLMTLPGVSQQVAQALLAAIGDIGRFPSPEKLASYLGLVPSTRQSATKCYHGGITKAGRVQARWALVQAAHSARNDLGPLGYFFHKVARRKSWNVAVVAVARKLAMLAWHLLTTRRPYRYAKPDTVKAKLDTLRVAGSGVKRRGGLGKGVDPRTARPKSEQGLRRTPSLPELMAREALPAPSEPTPGERKVLQNTGTQAHYEAIQKEQRRPRRGQSKATPAQDIAQVIREYNDS